MIGKLHHKIKRYLAFIMAVLLLFTGMPPVHVFADDLSSWSIQELGDSSDLNCITYGKNTFVIVGNNGSIFTSIDGTNWKRQVSGITNNLRTINYLNNTFVAVGENETILISSDGVIWESVHTSGTDNSLNNVAYGNNAFVAVGGDGIILTSSDGVIWNVKDLGITATLYSIGYDNNTFVVVGESGTILTSSDGDNWLAQNSDTENWLNYISYFNNTFVAVGDYGTVLTSSDGITWNNQTSGTKRGLNFVTYGNNTFVAVGNSGAVLTSSDGVTWNTGNSGSIKNLYFVTYGNNTFVAVGNFGEVLTSSDGVTWNTGNSGTTKSLYEVIYGNGTFVAIGEGGTILKSGQAPSSTCDITDWVSPDSIAVSGTTASKTVGYSTSSITVNVTVSDKAIWRLYSDSDCKNEITDKTMTLSVGVNIAYLKVTAEDGMANRIYTLTVTREKSTVPVDKYIITTIAGTGDRGYGGDGGSASSAILYNPYSIAIDSAGNVYFADNQNNAIRKINAGDKTISTIAGNGSSGYEGDGQLATSAKFAIPSDVAVDSVGNIYITDLGNNRLRKINAGDKKINTIAGIGSPGYSKDEGPAISTILGNPHGVAVDITGNVYITSRQFHNVKKINISNGNMYTIAGTGVGGYSGDGGSAIDAKVFGPGSVALDSAGNIYIADSNNNRIRRIDAISREISTIAGTGEAGYSGDGGPATSAKLNAPFSVALDSTGNIYIADSYNHRIRKINVSNGKIITIAGTGEKVGMFEGGYSGEGVPATSAKLNLPIDVAVDNEGNVYIADSWNNRIRILTPSPSQIAAPEITTQPSSLTVKEGQAASFNVTATGDEPLSYQWKKDGVDIVGATSSSYSIPSAVAANAGNYTVVVTNAAGSVISTAATLTVNPLVAPKITSQPSNLTVKEGQAASFSVTATGDEPISYQWKKDGVDIARATSSSYSIPSTKVADAGNYTVVITNAAGSVTSVAANLTVNPLVAPKITSQPNSLTVKEGQAASFSVTATGDEPISYQWKKDGVDIARATSSSYSIPSTKVADAGNYTVVVINAAGSVTSTAATLTVNPAAEPYVPPTPTPGTGSGKEIITVYVTDGKSDKVVSEATIERETTKEGIKKDNVNYNEKKAQETVNKLKEEGKDTARIVIPDKKDEVAEAKVNIHKNTLSVLEKGNINLEIDTENARISIPKESIKDISNGAKEDLFFRVVPIKKEEQKNQVEKRAKQASIVIEAAKDNAISIVGRPMTIETNMSQRPVDIILPIKDDLIPKAADMRAEFLSKLAVFIEHSDGEKELLKGEIVEYKAGVLGIKFRITKFSTFTILKVNTKELSKACDIITVKVPIAAELKGANIAKTVDNGITSIIADVTVSEKATWKLYTDELCTKEISDKIMKLKVGENKAYVKVTAEDGKNTKIYTIAIKRSVEIQKVIFIATKNSFADAYAGEVLAKKIGGEIVILGNSQKDVQNIVNYTTKNLTVKDTIYIFGLNLAVQRDVEKILISKGYKNIIRIGGSDKYETAKKISEKLNPKKGTAVVLVNGDKMPKDGISIKNVSAENGYPILFVKKDSLTKYTVEALKNINPAKIYIAGDRTQISEKAIAELQKQLKIKASNIVRIKNSKDIKK